MKAIYAIILATQLYTWSGSAQAAFTNLDFESANLPVWPGGGLFFVPISAGLPGWTGFHDAQQTTQILWNNITLGSVSIDILGPGSFFPRIEGNYSAVLQAGLLADDAGNLGGPVSATISQTGTVPSFATSILFDAAGAVDESLTVTFNGQNMPFVTLATGPTFQTYGGDISAFAGQTGQLSFSENPNLSVFGGEFATVVLDNISLVPEPGTWALLLCGVGFLVFREMSESKRLSRWRPHHRCPTGSMRT